MAVVARRQIKMIRAKNALARHERGVVVPAPWAQFLSAKEGRFDVCFMEWNQSASNPCSAKATIEFHRVIRIITCCRSVYLKFVVATHDISVR